MLVHPHAYSSRDHLVKAGNGGENGPVHLRQDSRYFHAASLRVLSEENFLTDDSTYYLN